MKYNRRLLLLTLLVCVGFIILMCKQNSNGDYVDNNHYDGSVEIPIRREQIIGSVKFIDEQLIGSSNSYDKITILPEIERVIMVKPEGQPVYGYLGNQEAKIAFNELGKTMMDVSVNFNIDGKQHCVLFEVNVGSIDGSGYTYITEIPSLDETQQPWYFWYRQIHKVEPLRVDYYEDDDYEQTVITLKSKGYSLSHTWKH